MILWSSRLPWEHDERTNAVRFSGVFVKKVDGEGRNLHEKGSFGEFFMLAER